MVPLFIVLLALILVGFPLWATFRILALERKNRELEHRLAGVEQGRSARSDTPVAAPAAPIAAPPVSFPAAASSGLPVPPPLPSAPPVLGTPPPPPAMAVDAPPPPTPSRPAPAPVAVPPMARPRRNWEQFTGTKLLAWTGGFAAFLGAAFFIKYSFEHDLIPPAVRVGLGYVFGLALALGGLKVPRPRYAATSHTLCATGIVCLYAVTFACNSIYDFPFFDAAKTFVVMALITTGAFLLAIRLRAQVVAVLGLLGGFLTPLLLSSGRDQALGLFSYVALLDIGLVALALHQRWLFLVPLGAAGTVAMQAGWAFHFLKAARAPAAMAACLTFAVLFLAAHLVARRFGRGGPWTRWPAVALAGVGLAFGLTFLGFRTISEQPGLLFGFVFALDACLLALAWLDESLPGAHLAGGLASFVLLGVWTGSRLTPELMPWALALYLLFGAVHTAFPLLLSRRGPALAGAAWGQWFPTLALVLFLVPVLKLDAVPFTLWPCILLVDLLAIALAFIGGSMVAVTLALLLTLAAAALWMLRLPPTAPDEPWAFLVVVGGFAAIFFAAGAWFLRRGPAATPHGGGLADPRLQLPAFSALMPFLLLIMMVQRLPAANSAGIFGLALALVAMGLALTRLISAPWLPACSLAGVVALEFAWDAAHPTRGLATPFFAWVVAFHAIFSGFPFLFRRHFSSDTGPFAVAALSGIAHFPLVFLIVERVAPADARGLVPALMAVPPLLSLLAVYRLPAAEARARLNQLAWYGGTALLFLTLVIPIQFNRQWVTIGWAVEGAALLWLFRRVPHPGLRATGVGLLVAAFVRLALNPAILRYHPRAEFPIFNWILYTYGVTLACQFAGAILTADPAARALGVRVRPLLNTLGILLAFLLLNLEIADFFQPPGAPVFTFTFSGHLARDMAYTIGWALFALGLLLASIWKRTRAGRRAALALLAGTVVKLFFHDLEHLGALHRIGALFAVAIIAIAASLAYQRFLPSEDPTPPAR